MKKQITLEEAAKQLLNKQTSSDIISESEKGKGFKLIASGKQIAQTLNTATEILNKVAEAETFEQAAKLIFSGSTLKSLAKIAWYFKPWGPTNLIIPIPGLPTIISAISSSISDPKSIPNFLVALKAASNNVIHLWNMIGKKNNSNTSSNNTSNSMRNVTPPKATLENYNLKEGLQDKLLIKILTKLNSLYFLMSNGKNLDMPSEILKKLPKNNDVSSAIKNVNEAINESIELLNNKDSIKEKTLLEAATDMLLNHNESTINEYANSSVENTIRKIMDIFDLLDEYVMKKNSRLERILGSDAAEYQNEIKQLKDHLLAAEQLFLFDIAQALDAPDDSDDYDV